MAIKTLPGKGTLLQLLVSSIYYTIGQRVSIDGPEPELKMRDVTNLDSPMVCSRPAIPDPGKISGQCFFDPNDSTTTVNHPLVRAKVMTPPSTPDTFRLVYADGFTSPANDVFQGFLTKWKVGGMETQSSVTTDWEIQITDSFVANLGSP